MSGTRLRITLGRILINQAQYATAVPTTHRHYMFHSQITNQNQLWALNNSARRYNLSDYSPSGHFVLFLTKSPQ